MPAALACLHQWRAYGMVEPETGRPFTFAVCRICGVATDPTAGGLPELGQLERAVEALALPESVDHPDDQE